MFPTNTSCDMYRTGTTQQLYTICYTLSSGKVSNAVPGVFFYWGKFTATAARETVVVNQETNGGSSAWLYRILQGNQISIWGDTCSNLVRGVEYSRGQGRVIITNAVIGQTYYISVKYDVKSIIGANVVIPVIKNKFSVTINGVFDPSSPDSVNAKLKDATCNEFVPGTMKSSMNEESEVGAAVPADFALRQSYPNPFNPSTIIQFELPEASMVKLSVFNILGQEVATLVNGQIDAGYQSVEWNANNARGNVLASGLYLYRIDVVGVASGKEFHDVRKMLLMR
jgi:hypothetical protein